MLRPNWKRKGASPITLADRAREARQWEVAAQYYRLSLGRNSHRPPIWVQYGHMLKESGNHSHAEAAYRRATESDRNFADAWLHLGHILKLQRKWADAKAAYQQAFALDSELDAARDELDREEMRRVSPDEVNKALASVSPAPIPEGKLTLIGRADRARDSALWELAARLYRKVLYRNPRNPPIWIQYGHVLKEAGAPVEAEAAYSMAVAHGPRNADALFHLGRALRGRGNREDAVVAQLRAFALDPACAEALEELRYLGWSQNDLTELKLLTGAGEDGLLSAITTLPSAVQEPDVAGNDLDGLLSAVTTLPSAAQEPDVAGSDLEALAREWAPHFDAAWYLDNNRDVAATGNDPFDHFLRYGLREGRAPSACAPAIGPSKPVTDAAIECLRKPEFRDETALFVTHSPHGWLKSHVPHYLASLRRHGISVVLIVAADRTFTSATHELVAATDGLFVRRNQGYDFAAWAHVLLLHPEAFGSKILYLVNDSVFGPTNDTAFGKMLSGLRASSADLIGLTENYDRGWHYQSYFLAIKARALASLAFQKFVTDVVSYAEKEDVINRYEVQLARILRIAGINTQKLFTGPDNSNPILYHWRYLLESGFPFLKVFTVRDRFPNVDTTDWRKVVAAQGYDVSLADRALAEAQASLSADPVGVGIYPLVSPAPVRIISDPIKIAFIGPWNYSNGLGVAGRGYISALRHSGSAVNYHPIRRPFHIHQQVAPAVDMCDFSGAADVVIIHVNPDGWPGIVSEGVFTDEQISIIERARHRVGHWVWELTQVPDVWLPVFDRVDKIWAPSQYCADIFSAYGKARIEVIPHVVSVPPLNDDLAAAFAVRQKLGVSEAQRIILYAFDGSSYLARKNPHALVRSYARSRLFEKGWRLVLKTKHLSDTSIQGERLRQEVAFVPGVSLIDWRADKTEMAALMQAADIYASPHCAEGFGLTIAEAMAMGKIVVATDYSGSRDFLDPACGFCVRYRLEPIESDVGPYRAGEFWAHIDETHLTESLMEAAARVASGDLSLGAAARRRIDERLSPAAVGALMRDSIARLVGVR